MAEPLYHVALVEDWEAAQEVGQYEMSTRGRTLEEEGFIHCSFEHQVDDTIARWYADLDEVLVLQIDPSKLPDRVAVVEGFPHIEGPIPTTAVVEVSTFLSPRV